MLDVTLEKQIRRARAAGEEKLRKGPLALEARFLSATRELLLTLPSGEELAFPVDQIQGLSGAGDEALSDIQIVMGGLGLHWEDLDADVLVPELVSGIYGTKKWMRAIGAQGGKAQTAVKRKTARENGARGGRPRTRRASRSTIYCFLIESTPVSSDTQFCGVLKAKNGRPILKTKPFSNEKDVVNCWDTMHELAINKSLHFEKLKVNQRWRYAIQTCDGITLGHSSSYASGSTASRALGLLDQAISQALISSEQYS